MVSDYDPRDFEIFYPGVYSGTDGALIRQYIAANKAIGTRGAVDPASLVAGSLSEDTPGLGPVVPVAEGMVRYYNQRYDPENPVLNDARYARGLGYQDILAMPCFGAHDDSFMVPAPAGARDTLLVSQLNHSVTSHRPVYPGDTLRMVVDSRTVTDLTPPEGSIFRSLAIRTEGSVYNQTGERVNGCVWRVVESMRVFRPGRRPGDLDSAGMWDAPAWTDRPAHCYTDEDWNFIIGVWSKEHRQGAVPLYWEDVTVGDEPAWTADGPLDEPVVPTAPFGQGTGGTRTLKKEIMDPELRKTLLRSETDGIYRTPRREDHVPPVPDNPGIPERIPGFPPDRAIDTRDIHRPVTGIRAPLVGFCGRDIALRHISDWMGDHGWLHRIGWGLMPPATMAAYGKPVPTNPDSVRFLDKVPNMRHRHADAHGMTTDLALVKSYVYDKYVRDGEFFVELAWWIEAVTGHIWTDGDATVRLPSRKARSPQPPGFGSR
jgi:hypothetical protein